MQKKFNTIKIVLTGLLMALIFILTRFTQIPYPLGYIHLGDSAIAVAGIVLGPLGGFIASSIGSACADLTTPFMFFAPITFVIKGFEAVIISLIYRTIIYKIKTSPKNKTITQFIAKVCAVVCGGIFMVTGYFIGEWLILPIFLADYGYLAAKAELILNIIQAGAGATVAILLLETLSKTKFLKDIF